MKPRPAGALLVAALALGAGLVAVGPLLGSPPAHAAETVRHAAGPLGAITVIGDSVMLGSMRNGPTLSDQLAARGWGPIRVRAGGGYNTGAHGGPVEFQTSHWISTWRQQGWDAPAVVINLGANDSGSALCGTDPQCAYEAITYLVDTIGPGHRIWWPKVTRFPYQRAMQDAWNAALDRVAAERADFYTWDWPTVMVAFGLTSIDWVHLGPDGYRVRSDLMATEITADLARGAKVGPDATLPVAIGVASEYVALPPDRVHDTRAGASGPVPAGDTLRLDMTPHVPSGTTAVAVNLTSDGSAAPGFLTAHPCDRPRRETSNVNHAAGVPRGALAVVPLSADGTLCVFSLATSHVIVDVQGAFVPAGSSPGSLRFTPLATPSRLLDTRATGRAGLLEVAVPPGAGAVALNLTAVEAEAPGWLKAWGCDGDEPPVSNVNFLPAEAVAGAAIVPVSDHDTICVRSLVPVDVIVDITGTFDAGNGLRFVPADPMRVLDTRAGIGGWAPLHGRDQAFSVLAAPPGAEAVTGTLTLVSAYADGWLRADSCGVTPPTSNVNAGRGQVMANSVTVGVDGGHLCVTSSVAAHSLLDVTGWWTS